MDPSPETYRLWHIFTDPKSGTWAVAMSTGQSGIFIALFTSFLTWIVAIVWTILVAFMIYFLAPTEMTQATQNAAKTAWDESDPLSASYLLMKHCWQVLRDVSQKEYIKKLTWKGFGFHIAIVVVAFLMAAGGFALTTLYPLLFVIGTIAPVNPAIVFLPLYTSYTGIAQLAVAVEYDSIAALKAFGSVDSTDAMPLSQDQKSPVTFEWQPLDSVHGEDRYSIQYNYKVAGTDMGLQKFGDLTLEVSGNCSFQDTWWYYNTSQPDIAGSDPAVTYYDVYINWRPDTLVQYPDVEQTPFDFNTSAHGNNSRTIGVPIYPRSPPTASFISPVYSSESLNQATGRSYFVIYPYTGRVPTVGISTDPWYATETLELELLEGEYSYMVKTKRPPLLCQEDNKWSYGSWKGTMQNLVSNGADGPPKRLPPGIVSLIQVGLGSLPMVVTLGRALSAASLKSVTRLVGEERAIVTENARARDDMERIVQAAYLATQELLRNSALAGLTLKADISSGALKNAMVDTVSGKPIPGSGDFVISSSVISALGFRQVMSVPCILVILLLIVAIFQYGRKKKAKSVTDQGESATVKPRRRFISKALHIVPWLYHLVDEKVGKDKEGENGGPQSQPAEKTQGGKQNDEKMPDSFNSASDLEKQDTIMKITGVSTPSP